jgi:hypothetical protein
MDWKRKHTVLVVLILLIGLIIRLIPLVPPELNLLQHSTDDAFYLYCIANNLVNGHGLSFDGVSSTSTARPLFVLLLAILELLFGKTSLPQTAYLFGAIADCLTGYFILRFLRRLKIAPAAAIMGMVFYIFSTRIIFYGVNGMETPFGILSITIMLNLYPIEEDGHLKKIILAVGRGLALAAMMLIRLDYAFMASTALIAEIWCGIRKKDFYWLLVGVVTGVAMLPWIWWSLSTLGRLMPPSGDALVMIFGFKPTSDLQGVVDQLTFLYYAFNNPLRLLISQFQMNWAVVVGFGFIFISYIFTRRNIFKTRKLIDLSVLLLVVILAVLPLFINKVKFLVFLVFALFSLYIAIKLYREKNEFYRVLNSIAPLAFGLLAMVLYYGLVRRYFRGWNMMEGEVFVSIILATFLAVIWSKKAGVLNSILIVIWVLITNIVIAYPCLEKGPIPWQDRLVRAADWVKTNTDKETVIAAANGGIIQWYGDRTLVDVAGIEDEAAYKALKEKKLYRYMKDRGVSYLIDPAIWPLDHYKDYWGVDITQKLEVVYSTDPELKDKYSFPVEEDFLVLVFKLK